jgi:hypothetical protein
MASPYDTTGQVNNRGVVANGAYLDSSSPYELGEDEDKVLVHAASRADAEGLLACNGNTDGLFLVRVSSKENAVTLCVQHGGECLNLNFTRPRGAGQPFAFKGEDCGGVRTVAGLVEYLAKSEEGAVKLSPVKLQTLLLTSGETKKVSTKSYESWSLPRAGGILNEAYMDSPPPSNPHADAESHYDMGSPAASHSEGIMANGSYMASPGPTYDNPATMSSSAVVTDYQDLSRGNESDDMSDLRAALQDEYDL